MLLGFQFRILLILREMQTKSTPPLPFLEKKQRNIFFSTEYIFFKNISDKIMFASPVRLQMLFLKGNVCKTIVTNIICKHNSE